MNRLVFAIILVFSPFARGACDDSRAAVAAALGWLERHQHADGSWRPRDHVTRCATRCRNIDEERHGSGLGHPAYIIGVTGLAMLAFLENLPNESGEVYKRHLEVVEKAARFLRELQARTDDPLSNGRYGPFVVENAVYNQAIATRAMCTYVGLLDKPPTDLIDSAKRGVQWCLNAQNAGYGWRYGVKTGDNDTSVTGWMVLALEAGRRTPGIDIPDAEYAKALEGARTWFDRATSVASGKTGYMVPGDPGARLDTEGKPYAFSDEISETTAIAVACRLLIGQTRGDAIIKRGVDLLMRETPTWTEQEGRRLSRVNLYYWYYGTSALRQVGGSLWQKWKTAVATALLDHQRRGGDEAGSWDPIGEWGVVGGRVYSTALGALTLSALVEAKRPPRSTEPAKPEEVEGFRYLSRNEQGYAEYRHEKTRIVFVLLPGGEFDMGSPPDEKGRAGEGERNELRHRVTLSPFLIAKHEVSQAEWTALMGNNPSRFEGERLPVEKVSWNDCTRFSRKAKLKLPTEAQWEYACRAGASTAFAFGNDLPVDRANFGSTAGKTTPVDAYEPNAFGLHNMHGNVEEWCRDVLGDFYTTSRAAGPDPICTSGPDRDTRVVRGGSWKDPAGRCRSAARHGGGRLGRYDRRGFRPVFELR